MGYFANGTMGEIYYRKWCSRCVHDGEFRKKGEGLGCPVWGAHRLYSYELCNVPPEESPGRAMLDMFIPRVGGPEWNGECTMFVEASDAAN